MIYVYARMRAELSEQKYAAWLASLNTTDMVAVQHFKQPNKYCSDMPMERWEFELCRVGRLGKSSTLCARGGSHPFAHETGQRYYWNSDQPWGDVFPSRVVPLHHEFRLKELGDRVIANYPFYEPLYLGTYRHVYFGAYGDSHNKFSSAAGKLDVPHYRRDVHGGELLTYFENRIPREIEAAKHLYSEWINP